MFRPRVLGSHASLTLHRQGSLNSAAPSGRHSVIRRPTLPPIEDKTTTNSPSPEPKAIMRISHTDDVRPIVVSLAYPFHKIRPPILMESCPRFLHYSGKIFNHLFQVKMRICSQLCDFSDGELELKWKQIKLDHLNEILVMVKERAKLDEKQTQELIDMILVNLTRTLPPIPNLSSAFDEEPMIVDPSWQHLSVVYAILNKLSVNLEAMDEEVVQKILRLLRSPNPDEREKVGDFVRNCFVNYENRRKMIYSELLNLLIDYRISQQYPYCVQPVLQLLLFLAQYIPLSQQEFMAIILPLMIMPHLRLFVTSYVHVLQTYMSNFPDRKLVILKYALKHWPKARASKQQYFISMILSITEKLSTREFAQVASRFTTTFSSFMMSPNVKVAEFSMLIWSNQAILDLIKANDKKVVPVLYQTLITVCNEQWNGSVQNMALGAMKIIDELKIDTKLEDDNSNTMSLQYEKFAGYEKQHTGWVLIARSAAGRYDKFDLESWLKLIGKEFEPQVEPVPGGIDKIPSLRTAQPRIPKFKSDPMFVKLDPCPPSRKEEEKK